MTINFAFISSHDNRIQCLLNSLLRLKNCAILKVSLIDYKSNNNYYKIKMIYEGEIEGEIEGEKADTFWILKSFNKNYNYNIYNKDISKFLFKNQLTIFIIRHGQGIHNIDINKRKILEIKDFFSSFFTLNNNYNINHQFFDANLTSIGIKQSINAGKVLKQYLLKKYKVNNINQILNNNYIICASKLYRTQQTILYIMSEIININNIKIFILPCINEISIIDNNGMCSNNNFKDRLSYENQTLCDNKNKRLKNKCIDNKIIDWSYYDSLLKKTKNSCINKNIIESVLKFINYLSK